MTEDGDLVLRVGSVEYGGWLSISVMRSIEQAASAFALSLTEQWPGETNPIRVHPGDFCEVLIGGEVVLTGYVDEVNIDHSADSHVVEVTGRSRTQDLVDCSCIAEPMQFIGRNIVQIAEALAEPYGVTVVDESDATHELIPRFSPELGETVFEAIERLAREAQLVITDDTLGNLVLTQVGRFSGPSFTMPGNILAAAGKFSHIGRYLEYRVVGQRAGDDVDWGKAVSIITGYTDDTDVRRRRVLVVRGEKQMTEDACLRRAIWESVTRVGRSSEVTATVVGWRDKDGNLYECNKVCKVVDPVLALDADLLSVEVTFSASDQGRTTIIRFAPPAAYTPLAIEKQKAKGKGPNKGLDIWIQGEV